MENIADGKTNKKGGGEGVGRNLLIGENGILCPVPIKNNFPCEICHVPSFPRGISYLFSISLE